MTEFVLLHGLGGSPAVWRRVLSTLQHHGRVHTPSLACEHSIADQAQQIQRWLAGRTETTSFVVVGHSLGGLVATSLAEQFPMLVERLVLINPPPTLDARRTANQLRERGLRTPVLGAIMWSLATRASLRRGLSSAVAPGFTVPDYFVDDLRATGLHGFRSADAALTAYLDADSLPNRLRKLDDRILRELVYGSEDQRVDPDSLAQLGSVMGAVTRIDGVGHTPQWELPAAVLNVLVDGGVDPVLPTAPSVRPPISPQRWTPPPAPKRARQSLETAGTVQRIELPGRGPEHVVADSRGRIVTGMQDGRLLRITLAGNRHALTADRIETIADTAGRPLGMTWANEDTLLVCDSERGLLQVNVPTGTISVLADRAEGTRLNFASNVVHMPSGVVYFSCSTKRFGFAHYLADLMEHSGTGSLMRITPDGAVEVIAEALHFANGIRVAADESYVDVVETGTFAVTRVHLTGTRVGEKTQLAGNLPGYPDNMHDDGDITWLALASPRNRLLDAVLPLPGIIRKAAWAGPDALRPVHRTVWVVGLDRDGRVVHDLQTGVADFAMVTSACPLGPHLVLGSITETALGVIDRPTHTPHTGASA